MTRFVSKLRKIHVDFLNYNYIYTRVLMWLKSEYINLPDQAYLCSKNNSSCSYIHKKVGLNRYERRLAIITEDGLLVVYKYFLLGVSAATPFMGRIYDLKHLKTRTVTNHKDSVIVFLRTKDDKELTIRLNSSLELALLPALLGKTSKTVGHYSHQCTEKALSGCHK